MLHYLANRSSAGLEGASTSSAPDDVHWVQTMRSETISHCGPPSKNLICFARELKSHSNLPLLDAGCGYGRNAAALASCGLSVVCVDKELERLNALVRFDPRHVADLRQRECEFGRLYPVLADLVPSQWPFCENCFSGIVCVHFLNVELFGAFRSSLVPGGYLYIETFGGHGGNYLDLPKAGRLRDRCRQKVGWN
jgi:SAM-dependent methyltransferase